MRKLTYILGFSLIIYAQMLNALSLVGDDFGGKAIDFLLAKPIVDAVQQELSQLSELSAQEPAGNLVVAEALQEAIKNPEAASEVEATDQENLAEIEVAKDNIELQEAYLEAGDLTEFDLFKKRKPYEFTQSIFFIQADFDKILAAKQNGGSEAQAKTNQLDFLLDSVKVAAEQELNAQRINQEQEDLQNMLTEIREQLAALEQLTILKPGQKDSSDFSLNYIAYIDANEWSIHVNGQTINSTYKTNIKAITNLHPDLPVTLKIIYVDTEKAILIWEEPLIAEILARQVQTNLEKVEIGEQSFYSNAERNIMINLELNQMAFILQMHQRLSLGSLKIF